MFKLKSPIGCNNLCGENLKRIRLSKTPPLSQRKLAALLQIMGYDLNQHFIRRIETGERYVTDIELKILSKALHVSIEELLNDNAKSLPVTKA